MKLRSTARLAFPLATALAALLGGHSAQAETYYWDSDSTTAGFGSTVGTWGSSLFWSTNSAGTGATENTSITSADTVNFGTAALNYGGATVAVASGGVTVGSIVFGAAQTTALTLGTAGNAITIHGGITKNAGSAAVTLASPIILGAAQTWTNHSATNINLSSGNTLNNNGFLLTLQNGVFDFAPGTTAATLSGSGGLTLDGARLFAIKSGGISTILSYTGTTTIQNGGSLLIHSQVAPTGNVTINGGYLDAYFGTGSTGFSLVATRALGAGVGQIQITGGTSGFSSNGGSTAPTTVTLDNNANTEVVWGSTHFNPTKLMLQADTAGSASSLTFANKLDLAGADRTVTVSGGTVGTATATISNVIRTSSGTAGLTKEGTGTLILSNSANLYSGSTTISAGTLRATSSGALGNGSTTNTVIFGGGTLQAGAAITSPSTRGMTFNSTGIIDTNTFAVSVAGNISGAAGLIKNGAGTLTLSGTNNYAGITTVNAGTLQFATQASLYNNTFASWTAANINVKGGATLALNVDVTGSAGFTAANLNTLVSNLSVANTAEQGLQAGAILGLDTTNAGGSFTPTAAITNSTGGHGGVIGLTKLGAGTLVLDQANTYTGTTTISTGILQLGSNSATGSLSGTGLISVASGAIFAVKQTDSVTQGTDFGFLTGAGAVDNTGAGTLVLNAANAHTGNTSATVGNITLSHALAIQNSALNTTGAGFVTLGTGITTPTFGGLANSGTTRNLATVISSGYDAVTHLTLNPQSGITFTYGGVIADGATGMSLTKTGAGTQVFQGSNSYTGATNLNAGTLTLSGAAGALASTSFNFNGGGLTLTNTSTTQGSVDRVSNSAAITSNGGTITYANNTGNTYAETLGSVTLTTGQLNLVETTSMATGSQTLTLSGLTNTSGTAAITFASAGGLNATTNTIVVTGAGPTAANQIYAPWATVGTTAALQTDYAFFNAASQVLGLGATSTTTDAAWTTSFANTSNYAWGNTTLGMTISSTKNINTLRHTGGAETLTLATGGNLGTLGILNGVSSLLTIAGTGAVTLPTTTSDNLHINTGSGAITINAPIANNGAGVLTLVKNGTGGTLTLGGTNTYSGGTVINAGTLALASGVTTAIGTGPITINNGGNLIVNNTALNRAVTLNGGTFTINPGSTETVLGTIALTANSILDYVQSNASTATIASSFSGVGGITKTGNGTLKLTGSSINYGGPTVLSAGILQVQQSLYGNDTSKWTPANITVNPGTQLALSIGGASDFTVAQAAQFITGISTNVNNNGLLAGATIGLDSGNAVGTVNFTGVIADSTGPGGGAVNVKVGMGAAVSRTIILSGNNTYTGKTTITNWLSSTSSNTTLSVSSFNSVATNAALGTVRSASSNLGAPTTVANGTIDIGSGSQQTSANLIYTGTGETTDRVLNFPGNGSSPSTIDQAGSGLLKFTSAVTNTTTKTLNLTGVGNGEFAGSLGAFGAINKSGTGTWTFSASNTYTGLTTVNAGALVLANANALNGGIGATGGLGALTFNGGVIGLGAGDFSRSLAAAGTVGAVTFTGNGGWAAYGTDRVVNLGGASAIITWATANTGLNAKTLILGNATATHTVDFQNPLDMTTGARTVQVDNGAAAIDAKLSGILSGGVINTPTLSKAGLGTLSVSNTNTYTGVTTISAGVLEAVVLANGGSNSSIGASTAGGANLVFGAASATLRYTGSSDVITNRGFEMSAGIGGGATIESSGAGTLSFNDTVVVLRYGTAAQTRVLTLGGTNTGQNTFGKVIGNNTTAAISLIKAGAGTWVLDQANTYTGATSVNAGKLVINGDQTLATGATSVASNAALGGIGTVGGSVSLAAESSAGSKNGGILAPTAAASGTQLKVKGTTTFATGSIFEWNMAATDPANDPGANFANSGTYGQLAGTGAITGSGAVFKILLGASNNFADAFWNSDKSWNNVFSGTGATTELASLFASFSGSGVTSTGLVSEQGQFTFNGTSTLSWSAVPEPSAALAGLLLGAGLLRRRRA